MSAEGSQNGGGGNGDNPNPRNRRSSITQAALSNLFQRGPPTNGSTGASFSGQPSNDPQRRRLSVTTLGLSGTSQNGAPNLGMRRGSLSTNSNNSDSIDENAIDDDEGGAKTAPTTPFTRRMSYGGPAMRAYRPGGSPGNGNNPTSPPPSHPTRRPSQVQRQRQGSLVQGQVYAAIAERRASVGMPSSSVPQASTTKHPRHPSDNSPRSDQQGFNWSEQLRSRAESAVSGAPRPSFSMASSPPKNGGASAPHHDRARSVSDMPAPPVQAPARKPAPEPRKPDAFQERILKGDFYLD